MLSPVLKTGGGGEGVGGGGGEERLPHPPPSDAHGSYHRYISVTIRVTFT